MHRGLKALGYEQLATLTSAAALTPPAGSVLAVMVGETQSIRWRDDGTNPTASVGMLLTAGTILEFTGNLAAFRAIEATSAAKLNVSYYGPGA